MITYAFEISQLEDEHLNWIVSQCRQNWKDSPEFFAAVGNAAHDEQQRRLLKPGDPSIELRVPWIVEDKETYQAACLWTVFSMQSAHEQQQWILRNFFDVLVQILYNQVDAAIAEVLQAGTVSDHAH